MVQDDFLFGPSVIEKVVVVVRVLYGMKFSGNTWRLHLANVMDKELGFKQ